VKELHQLVLASRTIYWINLVIAGLYLLFFLLAGKKEQLRLHGIALAGYVAMTGVVLLRYAIMKNHSDIHVIFVSRYLFVFAGSVYFYFAWLLFSQPFFGVGKNQRPFHPEQANRDACWWSYEPGARRDSN
jgi:FtsH-binding integral membrane protein